MFIRYTWVEHLTKAPLGPVGSGQGLSPPAQVSTSTLGTQKPPVLRGFMCEEHLPFRHLAPVLPPFPISSRHLSSPRHSSHWPQDALSKTCGFFSTVAPRWMAPAITIQSSFHLPRPLDSTSSKKLLPREKGDSDHRRRAGRGPSQVLPAPPGGSGLLSQGTSQS